MENIKIRCDVFEQLKIAAENKNLNKINEIVEKIELENLRKKILRAAFADYKKTGSAESLKIYIETKNESVF